MYNDYIYIYTVERGGIVVASSFGIQIFINNNLCNNSIYIKQKIKIMTNVGDVQRFTFISDRTQLSIPIDDRTHGDDMLSVFYGK